MVTANRIKQVKKRFGLLNPVFDEYGLFTVNSTVSKSGKYVGKAQGYRVDDRLETETQNLTIGLVVI